MRQSVHPSNEFNKSQFADLLKTAKGKDKIVDFSKNCGVSSAYIGKYINLTFDQAPTIGTLRRIAAYTELMGIEFESLATAAGYTEEDIKKAASSNPAASSVKSFDSIILGALSNSNFEWKFVPLTSANKSGNLIISLDKEFLSQWVFTYCRVAFNEQQGMQKMRPMDQSQMIFNHILFSSLPEKSKISIVTDSEELFKQLTRYKPKMLAAYLSVVLVDFAGMNVIDEVSLETALPEDKRLEQYTLK